jgi:hypothetical protein
MLIGGAMPASGATRLHTVERAVPAQPCSIASDGATLWAVSGQHCQVLSRSQNDGRTWLPEQHPPLASIEGPVQFEGDDGQLLVGPPLGTDVAAPLANRPLAVALTENRGRTWHASTLPCPAGSSARRLLAAQET